jgi:predicted metal-dependent phosphoesterase TrpH
VDPEAAPLREHAERAGRRREARMREMIERLVASGVEVTYGAVEAAAGPDREIIGRPHLAHALVQAGHVASVHEAFQTLIGDESDAFVPTHLLEPVGAIEVVRAAGGVPVWAHPPGDLLDPLLPLLIDAGLRGLEVYRPRHRRNDVLRLEQLCRSTGLLATGGSDWHGPAGGSTLGDFFVTADEIEGLLTAGGM